MPPWLWRVHVFAGQETGSPRAAFVKVGSPRPPPADAARSSNPSTSTPPRRASPQLPRSAEGRQSPLADGRNSPRAEAQPRQPLLPPVAPPAGRGAGGESGARASPGAAQLQGRTTPPGRAQGHDQGRAKPTATSDYGAWWLLCLGDMRAQGGEQGQWGGMGRWGDGRKGREADAVCAKDTGHVQACILRQASQAACLRCVI